MEKKIAKQIVSDIIDKTIIIDTMNSLDINQQFVIVKQTKFKFNYNVNNFKDHFHTDNYKKATISDLIGLLSLNIDSILPVPIINDSLSQKDYKISELPGLLILIFVNISKINSNNLGGSFNYLMNLLNNSNLPINSDFPINNTLPNNPPLSINNMITENINNVFSQIINISGNLQPLNNDYQNNYNEEYSNQINIMKNMGFTDDNKILESLIVSEGDVSAAIQYYLNS